MKKIALIALGALLILLASTAVRWIPRDHVAVSGQGDEARVIRPGPGLKLPFSPGPDLYPLELGPVTGQAPLQTSDRHLLKVGFSVSGRLDPARALEFHRKASQYGIDQVLSRGAAHAIAAAAAELSAEEILAGGLQEPGGRDAAKLLDQVGVEDVRLEIHLDSPETVLGLARALAPRGKAGLIQQAAERAIAGNEGSWRAHTALGLALEAQHDLHGAEAAYLDALALHPAALQPMAQLVSIYTAVGEFDKLDRVLGAALQASPASIPHHNWLAASYMKRGMLERAEQIYQKALELDPGNTVILNNLGGVYLKQERPDEALEAFRRAVAAVPRDRQSLYNLGVGLCALGDDEEGLAYLLKANEVAPGRPSTLAAIARAQRALGRASEAAEWERLAREATPGTGASPAASPSP